MIRDNPVLIFLFLGVIVGLIVRNIWKPNNFTRWAVAVAVAPPVYWIVMILVLAFFGAANVGGVFGYAAVLIAFAAATFVAVVVAQNIAPKQSRKLATLLFSGAAVLLGVYLFAIDGAWTSIDQPIGSLIGAASAYVFVVMRQRRQKAAT